MHFRIRTFVSVNFILNAGSVRVDFKLWFRVGFILSLLDFNFCQIFKLSHAHNKRFANKKLTKAVLLNLIW